MIQILNTVITVKIVLTKRDFKNFLLKLVKIFPILKKQKKEKFLKKCKRMVSISKLFKKKLLTKQDWEM